MKPLNRLPKRGTSTSMRTGGQLGSGSGGLRSSVSRTLGASFGGWSKKRWLTESSLRLLKPLIQGFLTAKRSQGLSKSALGLYGWTLRLLLEYSEGVLESGAALEAFLGTISGAPVTRHGHWRRLRTFYGWVAERQGLVMNPMAGVVAPVVRPTLPRVLGSGELGRVLAAAKTRRDKALVTLLVDTGVRIGEAAGLRWRDVSTETILVSGKTGPREIPISAETRVAMLGLELPWRGARGDLTLNGLQQVVQRCFERAGLSGRGCGPHTLRHSFATSWLRAGGDLHRLQRILGHARLQTTQGYLHLVVDDLVRRAPPIQPAPRCLEGLCGANLREGDR